MASLKRKHVNLTDQGHPSPPAGPTVHPDRVGSTQKLSARAEVEAAKVTLTSISTQPSLTVNAIQKAKKSVVKQRYLVKKAKKRRKIVAARKASAPKNKQWKADGDVENEELTSASGIRSNKGGQVDDDVQKEAKEDRLDAAKVDVEAGPSRPRNDSNGDAVTKDEHSGANGTYEVNDKERRKQEKREKKEEKESVDKITKKKRKHVEAIADDTEPPVFEVRASNDALITEETGQDIDEDAERERRRLEKREKRANRDKMRKTKPKEVEDDVDDVLDLRDDAFDAPKADVEEPLLSPPASPPALEAFPLPRPAPAPDPRVLAQQGLPVGLTDATFVDQDLRIRVDKLEYTRQGKLETGVSERMGKRLAEIGVEEFFAVQAAILPKLLPLRLVTNPFASLHDYLISAPTGSGKTLAYAIPIIEILSQRAVTRLRALIVLPTRDLVVQVRETMEALAKGTGLTIGSVTGQHSFTHEQGQLVADLMTPLLGGSSRLDILIATPGRLMDHLAQTPNFSLQHLRFLVIDEADRLLNQSFQDWLSQVLSHILPPAKPLELPEGVRRIPDDSVADAWQEKTWYEWSLPVRSPCQKLLFSATLTRDPQAIASLNLRHPLYFIVQSPDVQPDATTFGENFALPTSLSEKMLILPPALKPLNLIYLVHHPEHKVRGALVFAKSVESAARLVKLLEFFEEAWVEEKVVVRGYTSEMKPAERKRLLGEFAEGEVHLLICSDLIARGMDLPTVTHVISYDVPLDMRKYVHRVGRTARAGRPGTAWTLVEKQEALHFKGLLKAGGRGKKVRKIKVKEEGLAPYRASYEIAMGRLKGFYGRNAQ